jgi:uncharacterized protein (DUF2267 family)
MDERVFIDRVCALGGIDRESGAERIVEAVLETLGERLPAAATARMAAELSGVLGEWASRRRVPGSFSLAELYDRVQRRGGRSRGFAVEQTQVVCAALREQLPPDLTAELRSALPAPIAELLVPVDRPPPPERRSRPDARSAWLHTLATGRPGSLHPLSEARPDPAHAHSVVSSSNPHEETKLSSSRGTTQERHDESLATGRPGPRKTIASR